MELVKKKHRSPYRNRYSPPARKQANDTHYASVGASPGLTE